MATTEKAAPVKLLSPRARLSYFHGFKGKRDDHGTLKYQTVLIFDKAAQATPEFAAMHAAAVKKREEAGPKFKNAKLPWRDGGEKDDDGYGPGTVYINVSTTTRPEIVDEQKNDITDESELGSGDYVRCSLTVYFYDKDGNRGVSFGLRNIQRVGKGEPLGSRSRAQDDFDTVASESGDVAEVKSLFG